MPDNNKDLFAAFAIGAIVGVGATMLLSSDDGDDARRILDEIEPAIKRARKKTRRFRNDVVKAGRRSAKRARRRLHYR